MNLNRERSRFFHKKELEKRNIETLETPEKRISKFELSNESNIYADSPFIQSRSYSNELDQIN